MSDRFDCDVHIEIRPIQVVRLRPGDVQQLFHGGLLKPGEFLERKEQLFIGQE